MSVSWAIFVGVAIVFVAIFFCVVGMHVASAALSSDMRNERIRAVEAERQLHDLTRQAFIAMAQAAEEAQARQGQQRTSHARSDLRFPGELS
jgi:hypothetical protein